MAENGNGLKLNPQLLAGVVIVVVAAVGMLGFSSRISALEQRAGEIEVQLRDLEKLQLVLDDVERKVADIRDAREDIIRAVCDAVGRRPEQCGLVPSSAPSP